MFGGQEVVSMRTYTLVVCPACRRQCEQTVLTCHCLEVLPELEPVELEVVAVDDPRIIAGPDLIGTCVRASAPRTAVSSGNPAHDLPSGS